MKNEPVAFVTGLNKFDPVMVDTVLKVGTPLYTHPAKEKGLPRSNPLPMNQAYLTRSDNYTPIAWSCWSEGMQAAIITTTEPDMCGWQSIIPLFSHPAKTLDRELLDKTIIDQQNEIKELRKNLDVALMIVDKPVNTLTDEELVAHVPLMAWEVFSSSLFMLEDNEITNDEFIKRCYEVVKARCNHPQPDYTQFNTQSHPFKTLTDEEINELWLVTCSKAGEVDDMQLHFARAILRKAQEK